MDSAFSNLYSITRAQTEKMAHNLNKIEEHIIRKLTGAVLVPRDVASRTRRDTSLKILAVVEKLININYQLETIASEDLGVITEQPDHLSSCRRTEDVSSTKCLEGSTQVQISSSSAVSDFRADRMRLVKDCCPLRHHQPEPQQKPELSAEREPPSSTKDDDDVFKIAVEHVAHAPDEVAVTSTINKGTSPGERQDSENDQKTRDFEKYYAAMYIRRTGGGAGKKGKEKN